MLRQDLCGGVLVLKQFNLDTYMTNSVIHPDFNDLSALRAHFGMKLPASWWYKPVAVEVEMTHVCNLRCEGCAVIEDVEQGYDGFAVEKILSTLEDFSRTSVYAYSLTGGEPLAFLGRTCEIISKSPLDLFKLNTNGKVFSSLERARDVLECLRDAGLESGNRYIRPSLNVSLGLQTEAGTPLVNIAYLAQAFQDVFADGEVELGLNFTTYRDEDVKNLYSQLDRVYFHLTGQYFPFFSTTNKQFYLQYTPRLAAKGRIPDQWVSVGDMIDGFDGKASCFNFSQDSLDTPVPRLLVRADGGVYACSCFGHAGLSGNIYRDQAFDIIAKINGDSLLKTVSDTGLPGLFSVLKKANPGIEQTLVPGSFSICKVCKVLREPEKLDPVHEPVQYQF